MNLLISRATQLALTTMASTQPGARDFSVLGTVATEAKANSRCSDQRLCWSRKVNVSFQHSCAFLRHTKAWNAWPSPS